MNKEKLSEILSRHNAWIKNEGGGERANLSCADLRDADLSCAKLSGADLHDADLRDADLSCADLRDADLSCADLSDADLSCADLNRANLNLARGKVLCIGPIGCRQGITYITKTKQGIYVRCGCFYGTIEEFIATVEEKYGNDRHGMAYKAAIAFIKAHDSVYWNDTSEE